MLDIHRPIASFRIRHIKLAPFKLRFSRMTKSPSGGHEGSRSNSVECCEETNLHQHQQQQQHHASIQTLASPGARPESSGTDENALTVRNEPLVPNSPPPSYEHVLEETRLAVGQSGTNAEDEIIQVDGNSERHRTTIGNQTPSGEGSTDGGGRTPVKGPEILHKSSKELYKAVAKQWGITCKMSDQCRCFDCQSHYFDCEYERDEQEKTDGGLGAGTPMFLSEVMHGSACTII